MRKFALLSAAVTTMACARGPIEGIPKAGDSCPAFSAKTDVGKEMSLQSLTKNGPAFVIFFKEMCSANPRAIELYEKLYQKYGKKTTFIGVVNGTPEGIKSWRKEFGASFPVLSDPEMKIIGAFGLDRSTYGFEIGKDQKIAKVFLGFGQKALGELDAELAAVSRLKTDPALFAKAPKGQAFG